MISPAGGDWAAIAILAVWFVLIGIYWATDKRYHLRRARELARINGRGGTRLIVLEGGRKAPPPRRVTRWVYGTGRREDG